MPIGDGMNNNNNRSNREYTYYPRINNIKCGSNSLAIEYRSGLLTFKILSLAADGFTADKEHPLGAIYLSATKAMLLAQRLKEFRNYLTETDAKKIDPNKAWGVNGGMGEKISYIAFHTNAEKDVMIDIGKFDGEGKILESGSVTLKKDYHYGLEWNNLSAMDITKVYNDTIELDQIMFMVEDFGRYMNGALAYSVHDLGRYDLGRIMGKMDPIYDKLGIERLSDMGNYKARGTNNFLSNTTGRSESVSYESLQDMLD